MSRVFLVRKWKTTMACFSCFHRDKLQWKSLFSKVIKAPVFGKLILVLKEMTVLSLHFACCNHMVNIVKERVNFHFFSLQCQYSLQRCVRWSERNITKYVTKVLSTTLNASCLSNEIMIDFILECIFYFMCWTNFCFMSNNKKKSIPSSLVLYKWTKSLPWTRSSCLSHYLVNSGISQ